MFKSLTTNEFIEKAKDIHGDKYDYSKSFYRGTRINITITCPIHGDFEQMPNNHLSGNGCKKCFSYKQYIKHVSNKEEFIDKSILKHGYKFNYNKVIYINNYTDVIITCKMHGDFQQSPRGHLSGKGCIKCLYDNKIMKQPLTLDNFIDRANKVHNFKYEYNKSIYINAKTKIIITCKQHGDFKQKPFNHLSGKGCPNCKASKGELAIKSILDKYNIKSIHQYRIPEVVNELYYDFCLPEYNLLIEFHGIQHYEYIPFFHDGQYTFEDQKNRDDIIRHNAFIYKYNYLEFNYKQLKHLSKEQFEQLVINDIRSKPK